jgi:hypothetical protein
VARQLRIEYEGAFYHVTSRRNQRGEVLWETPDKDKFIKILGRTKERQIAHCNYLSVEE